MSIVITAPENLTEAESSIRDTDMASEMMNYTKFNILQQAAQSMLAQAAIARVSAVSILWTKCLATEYCISAAAKRWNSDHNKESSP